MLATSISATLLFLPREDWSEQQKLRSSGTHRHCYVQVCTLERANRAMSIHSIMVPDQAPAELIPLIEACRADDPLDRPDIGKICDWLEAIY